MVTKLDLGRRVIFENNDAWLGNTISQEKEQR